MKPFKASVIATADNLRGTLILPLHLYSKIEQMAYDPACPDDEGYIVDEEGRVFFLRFTGRNPAHGEPGYKAMEEEH